jgi:hypothetical protein
MDPRCYAVPTPRCYPVPTPVPDIGLLLKVEPDRHAGRAQVVLRRRRRRLGTGFITTRSCPFWRTVLSQLLAVVGGRLRKEYERDPELTIKPIRPRHDLGDDAAFEWLQRRGRRYVLGHLDVICRLD